MKACKRREGIGGLEGKALQSQVQAHLGTRTQMYPKIFAAHQGWLDNIVRPMRPAPAVVPAPPLAAHQLADDAVGTDIVGHDAIISGAARLPGLQIIQYPLPVLVFARVEVRVGNQAGGTQVEGHVAAQQVEEREGEEGFIAVVRAVHARPHRALDQGAVRAGAVRDKRVGSAVHHRYQLALAHGPVGWLLARLCCQCCTGHFTVFRVKFDAFCSLTYKTNIYHIRGCTRANGV